MWGSSKGLSLLEVLMAMLLIGIAASGGIFSAVAIGKYAESRLKNRLEAVSACQSTVEWLKTCVGARTNHPYHKKRTGAGTGWALASGSHTDPFPAGTILSALGAVRTYEVTNVDINSDGTVDWKRVRVRVGWDEKTV